LIASGGNRDSQSVINQVAIVVNCNSSLTNDYRAYDQKY
jgi:hypothetical protein